MEEIKDLSELQKAYNQGVSDARMQMLQALGIVEVAPPTNEEKDEQ